MDLDQGAAFGQVRFEADLPFEIEPTDFSGAVSASELHLAWDMALGGGCGGGGTTLVGYLAATPVD